MIIGFNKSPNHFHFHNSLCRLEPNFEKYYYKDFDFVPVGFFLEYRIL